MQAKSGEVVLILGANGAGKSTLLKVCSGLWRSDLGKVELNPSLPVNQIGYASHQALLYGALTVRENMQLMSRLYGSNADTEEALKIWGLSEHADSILDRLSKGTIARAALCRAFINNPRLLLLDEPSSNLDDAATEILKKLVLQQVSNAAALVIIASHDLHRILPVATRVVMLESGEIAADSSQSGSIDGVVAKYQTRNR